MITVICPAYNEESYIELLMHFFVSAPPSEKELVIIDGGSVDRTRQIVEEWQKKHANIRLMDNPQRYVPFALNKAIRNSTGDPIIRLDAHTEYADDYFEKIMETFRETGADIVGGPMRAFGKTALQQAIATATSTKFGIGDSSFHHADHKGYVDTVYLGAWKRSLFNEAGMFDVQMVRNQDDEFHYRAKSMGKKIYLNPAIRSRYYPRNSYKKLFSQYYQYGLYKPLVLKKVRSGMRLRHFVPALFVGYLATIPVLFYFINVYSLIPLAFYLVFDLLFSFGNGKNFMEKILAVPVYPVLHISYGSGFIAGLFRLHTKKKISNVSDGN
jgi:succinoglycan biosynthesis protein ExoA